MNMVYKVIAFENPTPVIEDVLKDTDKVSLSASFFVSKSYGKFYIRHSGRA